MKLYGFPPSPNTWKVRAVAAHLGIPLELEFVDLTKGGSHSPDYLALNPSGRTPTLVDGDFKLWESTAIMQYLASQKPNSLWPDNARTRADIMRWQSWAARALEQGGLRAAGVQPAGEEAHQPRPARRGRRGQGLQCFHKDTKVLDAHLAQAALSRRQGVDAGGFLGRRAAVLHQGGRAAGRPLSRTCRSGSAASRRCRAGARPRRRRRLRRRDQSSSQGERAASAALFIERSAGRRSPEPCRQRGVAHGN